MSQVMSDISSVKKDQKNTAQGFKFRGIDQFVNALYPALTKHGVFMAPKCVSESHEIREVVRGTGKTGVDKHVSIQMEYTFWAEDGSSIIVGPIPAEGLDSGDKATNKALSAALKYALIQTFSIPTEDMAEADLDSPEIGQNKNNNSLVIPNVSGIVGISNVVLNATTELAHQNVDHNYQQPTIPVKKASFRKTVVKEEPKVETESEWEN